MRRALIAFLVISVPAAAGRADDLKTTRIALFSSGVGYFESGGAVEGDASVELTFRTDQVNDLLKSLVLRDLDGGSVAAVEYPARDPVEKTLKSFGVDVSGRPTLGQLCDQLRGVEVEVQAATTVTGHIFGVERRKTTTEHGGTIERDVLTVLAAGGLRSFELASVAGVKIRDAKVEVELQKALATLATNQDVERRRVTLAFRGQGKRRVRVGYVLETPIWKASYRLELGRDQKPYMQGWGLVENTTEQDWEDVRLSLVSGRPISFRMDLYQPLYVPRPMEQMELYASLRPPTFAAAQAPGQAAGGLAGGRYLGKRDRAAAAPMEERGMVASADEATINEVARLAGAGVESMASGGETGELFEYQIQKPVSLKRQHSAMLPIVTQEVEGAKLSVFDPGVHGKHPINTLRLKNSSALHLVQGPVTIFDDGIYAGDAKLPDLQPGEERLVGYALDLATDVDVKPESKQTDVAHMRIAHGTIWLSRKAIDVRVHTVKNKGESSKTVLLEQSMGPEWKLVEPKEPAERTADTYRFKVDAGSGESKTLTVRFEQSIEEAVGLTNLGSGQISIYVKMTAASEGVKKALARIIDLRSVLESTRKEISRVRGELDAIAAEQSRIRENMKVLSQNSDVYRRYEKKFGDQETKVEGLRERLATLEGQEKKQSEALDAAILAVEVE